MTSLVFCCLLWVAQQPTPALTAEGTKAIDAGRYPEAIKLLQQAVSQSPDDVAAWFHLALAQALSGEDPAAIESYRKTLKLKPDLYEAQVNLGQVLLRANQFAEAAEWLNQALAKKPTDPKLNSLLGRAYLGARKAPEAEARYRVLSEAEPKNVEAWMGLARALSLQENKPAAAAALERALELEPANRDLLLEAAELYEAAGKRQQAMALYAKVPEEPAVRERLGNLLLEEGRPAEAIPHLAFAEEKSPTSANLFALAVAYVRDKKPELAIPLLQKTLQAEPSNTAVRMFYGRLLRDQRRFGPAAVEFERVVSTEPGMADAWNELAGALILSERYPEAVQALDQVRKLKGESAAYHYFRALSLDHMKQYKPALESYQRFLELSQNQSPDEEFKARQRVIVIQKVLSK